MRLPSSLIRASLRKRLWLAAGAMLLFLGTLAIGNLFIAPERAVGRGMLGHDFLAFYTAGSFVREGRARELYDLEAVKQFERQMIAVNHLEAGDSFGPWWNPPFYAWVFAPLSAMPYRAALDVWLGINLVALAGAIVLLCRMLPSEGGWRGWGLVPVTIVTSMPFIQALSHAQNTFTSLLLLAATVTAWRSGRAVLAGLVAGLLFYKPQLAAVLAAVLVLSLGWRALLGLGISGTALLLLMVLTMPGSLGDWLRQLPANVHFMQVENAYLWERHVTFKAFWRLLLQGRDAGEPVTAVTVMSSVCAVSLGVALAVVLSRHWRAGAGGLLCPRDPQSQAPASACITDRVIAATIATMPLLMPFYFDYDLMLLAVPAVLFSGELARRAQGGISLLADRWLLGAWVVLFAWLLVNPGLARMTHVNLTVPLLALIAGLLIGRAMRRAEPAAARPAQPEELFAAAA